MIDDRQFLVALFLGHLDAAFDVADRFEIFGRASCRSLLPKCALQMRDLLDSPNRARSAAAGCASAALWDRWLPLSPNIRSNTTRGIVLGRASGVLALFQ